jgi:hypothetical protein
MRRREVYFEGNLRFRAEKAQEVSVKNGRFISI